MLSHPPRLFTPFGEPAVFGELEGLGFKGIGGKPPLPDIVVGRTFDTPSFIARVGGLLHSNVQRLTQGNPPSCPRVVPGGFASTAKWTVIIRY